MIGCLDRSFSAPEVGGGVVAVSGNVPSDGTTPINVTLQVTSRGQPLGNAQVTVQSTGVDTIVQPGLTDAEGYAHASLTSKTLGTRTLSTFVAFGGYAVPLPKRQNVTFGNEGTANDTSVSVAVNPSVASTDANAPVTVLVTVLDAARAPVPDVAVSLSGDGAQNYFTSATGNTDSSGKFSTTLYSPFAQSENVIASVANLTAKASVEFTPGAPSSIRSSLVASPDVLIADGIQTTLLKMTIADVHGNGVPSVTVTFTSDGSGDTFAPASGVSSTDVTGVASLMFSSTVAQVKHVAGSSIVGITRNANVVFKSGPPSTSTSSLTVSPASISTDAGNSGTLTATLRDSHGNLVADGTGVTFAGSGGNNIIVPSTASTTSGIATASIASTLAQNENVVASGTGFSVATSITFIEGFMSATRSVLGANPTSVVANNTNTTLLTINAVDAQGNFITGQAVTFASSGGNNIFVPGPVCTTNPSGVCSITLASSLAQSKTLTASARGGSASGSVTFIAGPVNSGRSSLVISPTQLVADGSASANLVISALDAFGNAAPGQAVSFTVSGTSNTLTPATGFTSSTGAFTATLSSTSVQSKTVSASIGVGNVNGTVSFIAGPVSSLVLNALPASTQQGIWISPVVTAYDAQGHIASSYTGVVTFTSTDTAARLPASYSFTATDAGAHTFSSMLQLVTNGSIRVSAGDSTPRNSNVIVTVTNPTGVVALPTRGGSPFTYQVCAILSNLQMKCWGQSNHGQTGYGDLINRGTSTTQMGSNLPYVPLPHGQTIGAVSMGADNTCVIFTSGQLACWARNEAGQCGYGDTLVRGASPNTMGDALPFVNLGTGRTADDISVSQSGQFCAVLDNGVVKCWGLGSIAQGYGDTANRGGSLSQMGDGLPAVSLGTNRTALAVSVGSNHTCAILDTHQVKCWGQNSNGQLGYGDSVSRGTTPISLGDNLPLVPLGTNRTATSIIAGLNDSCALLDKSQVKCWGQNPNGDLGLGDASDRGDAPNEMGDFLPAVLIPTGRTVTTFGSGDQHSCAMMDNNQTVCWGHNSTAGDLGYGDITDRGTTSAQMGNNLAGLNFNGGRFALQTFPMDFATCALLNGGFVQCWGYNAYGQLGLGDITARPVVPSTLTPISLW